MIRKCMVSTQQTPTSPPHSFVRVTFELPSCTWADRISVCGDFNAWQIGAMMMRQGRDGVWRATIDLDANRKYEFRYSMDGTWQTDYHADGWANNPHGSENSVVDTGLLSEGEVEIIETPRETPREKPLPRPINGAKEPVVPAPFFKLDELVRLPYANGGQLHEGRQSVIEGDVSQRAHSVRRAA